MPNSGVYTFDCFGLSYEGVSPLNPKLIWLVILLTLSAFVASAITLGKDSAILLGKIYTALAIATCLLSSAYRVYNDHYLHIPFELILLLFFNEALYKKSKAWADYPKIGSVEQDAAPNPLTVESRSDL